jgi:hypothetical protein
MYRLEELQGETPLQLGPHSRRKEVHLSATSSFPGVSLHDFVEHTAIYERQSVPFSTTLRRATQFGMAFTLLTSALLLLLPGIAGNLKIVYFPLFLSTGWHSFLASYIQWLASSALLHYSESALIGCGVVLLILTRNLQRGQSTQQWIAFAQVIGGSLNLLLLILTLVLLL